MVIGPVIETSGKSAHAITSEVEEWIENKMVQLTADETGQS